MRTALCSAVAALCAAALLSSIEAEGNRPPPCPFARVPHETTHQAQAATSPLSF